jgi:hypothetical protein
VSALQKIQDYILESWLPTKLTILIAGSTISLTLLAIGLPEYLQKISIQLSAEKTLLLRIVVPLTLLYLGTFIVLLLVLRHCKSLKSLPPQIQLSPLQEDILKYLYGKDYVSQILLNLALNAERETVTVNLEALEVKRMVSGQKHNKKLNIPDWRIEQRGNDYILDKGIVKK